MTTCATTWSPYEQEGNALSGSLQFLWVNL